MTAATSARALEPRHLQLARAAFAAIAAAMITFSPDHSSQVGLAVFSGFAIATGLSFLLSVWLVFPAGERWPSVLMGILAMLAGMIAGLVGLRSITLFFSVVVTWALLSGLIETIVGWRARRALRTVAAPDEAERTAARDALTVGIITIVLGLALLVVPTQYALQYYIEEAGRSFILTGITIGVGIFGGYAAIVAVYLAIAGFSPRRTPAVNPREDAAAQPVDEAPGGTA
ncbi:acyl-CoA synthetase [Microbacterium sp. Root61]|uniref:hypothetical protein n=1 Tax=Microbacterium sp. Root61 TaxID=1736570 RepID=UPI0006FB3659|nr:hypothetical protein [Microbacterium sp. Root61]KRA25221.1 acyl-CoA synthetase [Microbacterium sp. Root61]